MAIQQDANRVSCQVTVDTVVTGIDVSSTLCAESPGRTQSDKISSELNFRQERLVEFFVPGHLGDLVHQNVILCESEDNDS